MCIYFAVALLIPGIILAAGLLTIDKNTKHTDDEKSFLRGVLMIFCFCLAAGYLLAAWFQACIQKSFREASQLISGANAPMADNEIYH